MIETAKNINKELKKTNEYKEYNDLKNQIENNDYLNKLLKDITDKQNKMKKYLKENDLDNYKKMQNELNSLKNDFINHPLINNYINAKEILYNLVEQVASIISEE